MRAMPAPVLMVLATLHFDTMGVCVRLASAHYGTGEIVLYRGRIGMAAMAGVARWRGERLRTPHAYRVGSTLANASLQSLGIAFSFGYGALLFHDPVTWRAVAGMLLIVAGVLAATLVRSRTAPKDTQESTTEP